MALVSETARKKSNRQLFMGVMVKNEAQMKALYIALGKRIQEMIARETNAAGKVPLTRSSALRADVKAEVQKLFLGTNHRHTLSPFEVYYQGRVVPLSPYFSILWENIHEATRLGVQNHADIMLKKLKNRPDLIAAMQNKHRSPFSFGGKVSESKSTPKPLPIKYDPRHVFVDKNGYTLSDRVWRAAAETTRKIDLFLADGIASGTSSLDISKDVERFVVPGRGIIRTNKPYGTNASYDGMRLARTEITAANATADYAAAQLNPYIDTYQPNLSQSHPKEDECDEIINAGPYKLDDDSGIPPFHPHCLCYCTYSSNMSDAQVTAKLSTLWNSTNKKMTLAGDGLIVGSTPVHPLFILTDTKGDEVIKVNPFSLTNPINVEWLTALMLSLDVSNSRQSDPIPAEDVLTDEEEAELDL